MYCIIHKIIYTVSAVLDWPGCTNTRRVPGGDFDDKIMKITYQKALALIAEAVTCGSVQIKNGVWLETAESLAAEQEKWPDTDFSTNAYWIVTGDESEPEGVYNAEELMNLFN